MKKTEGRKVDNKGNSPLVSNVISKKNQQDDQKKGFKDDESKGSKENENVDFVNYITAIIELL